MGEIFDYIKSIKISRKYLVLSLILSEILGIIVLIWVLRIPLYEKYLISLPKAYSIQSMNPDKRYLVKIGDYLIAPEPKQNEQIYLLISTDSSKLVKQPLEKDNNRLFYQFSPDSKLQNYTLYFATVNNQNNKLLSTTRVIVRLTSNQKYRLPGFLEAFFGKQINTQPQLIQKTTIDQLETSQQSIYSFQLDINSAKVVNQISSYKSTGQPTLLRDRESPKGSDNLNLELTYFRKDRTLIEKGWISAVRIDPTNNKAPYKILLSVDYIKDAILVLKSANKIIWTGVIQ